MADKDKKNQQPTKAAGTKQQILDDLITKLNSYQQGGQQLRTEINQYKASLDAAGDGEDTQSSIDVDIGTISGQVAALVSASLAAFLKKYYSGAAWENTPLSRPYPQEIFGHFSITGVERLQDALFSTLIQTMKNKAAEDMDWIQTAVKDARSNYTEFVADPLYDAEAAYALSWGDLDAIENNFKLIGWFSGMQHDTFVRILKKEKVIVPYRLKHSSMVVKGKWVFNRSIIKDLAAAIKNPPTHGAAAVQGMFQIHKQQSLLYREKRRLLARSFNAADYAILFKAVPQLSEVNDLIPTLKLAETTELTA